MRVTAFLNGAENGPPRNQKTRDPMRNLNESTITDAVIDRITALERKQIRATLGEDHVVIETRTPNLFCGVDPDAWIRILTDVLDEIVREYPDLGRQPDAVLVSNVHCKQRQLPVH